MQSFVISAFLLLTFVANAQYKSKKYIRANKNAVELKYADGDVYARGLLIAENRIILGNSDGSIHYIGIDGKMKRLFQLDDFIEIRDVERSGDYLFGMKSGETGKLIRIHNRGNTETIKYPEWDSTFFDGLDFNGQTGFLMGDPRNGVFELYHSIDGGENWSRCEGKIKAFEGEAGFAASGTNVQVLNDSTYVFVSGGVKSRFFKSTDNGKTWNNVLLPFFQEPSSGAFSVCFQSDSIAVVVGGDYLNPDLKNNTAYFTWDGGETWYNSINPPRGYRACVIEKNDVLYCGGRNGIDFSVDGGRNWIPFANGTFFSLGTNDEQLVATSKNGTMHFFNLIEIEK